MTAFVEQLSEVCLGLQKACSLRKRQVLVLLIAASWCWPLGELLCGPWAPEGVGPEGGERRAGESLAPLPGSPLQGRSELHTGELEEPVQPRGVNQQDLFLTSGVSGTGGKRHISYRPLATVLKRHDLTLFSQVPSDPVALVLGQPSDPSTSATRNELDKSGGRAGLSLPLPPEGEAFTVKGWGFSLSAGEHLVRRACCCGLHAPEVVGRHG